MGAYRSKPEKEKIYESGGNDSIRFASCSMQGWRINQEDAHNCIIDFMPNMSFFAVYDGHGGPEVAQYLSLNFPNYLKNLQILNNFDSENLPSKEEIQNILRKAFLQFDETLTNPNILEKLTILKGDGEQQKDEPKTEQEEQEELMEEAIALSKESRISLNKIIKRYEKYQEYLIKNSEKDEIKQGEMLQEEAEDEEEIIEWSSERSLRRATKRSVMIFNSTSSPQQIPKRIKLGVGSSSEGDVMIEEHNVGTSKSSCSSTQEIPFKEENKEKEDKDDIPMDIDNEKKNEELNLKNKNEKTSPTNGKMEEDKIKNKKSIEVDKKKNDEKEEGESKEVTKIEEAVQLIVGKEEELKLPQLEEFEVSSTSTTTTTTNITKSSVKKDSSKVIDSKTSTKKKSTTSPITQVIKKEETKNKIIEEIQQGPSSSNSNINLNIKKEEGGIAQLLLENVNDNNDEEDSDYKIEEDDEDGDIADSTSNDDVEDEEEDEEGEGIDEEEEEDSLEEEDLNSMLMRTGNTRAGFDSGSTACVAFVLKKHIIVANVGDTRSVLCRSKKAIDLSSDHKPEDDLEKQRIIAAGGSVSYDGRVNGGLNLSRAFGDHFYKQEKKLGLDSQQIIATPDITLTSRDFENDEFLIVACDGIWNSLTSQQVCDFIMERINRIGLKEIVAEICDHCCANDTDGDGTGCDNETIILIDLKKERIISPQVSSSTQINQNEEKNKEKEDKKLNNSSSTSTNNNILENTTTTTITTEGIFTKNDESQNC